MGVLLSHLLSLSSLGTTLIIGVLLLPKANGQDYLQVCSTTAGTYAANSTYEANLNRLLTSLDTNGPTTGFFLDSVGSDKSPDRVFGFVICGDDVNATACRSCVRGVTTQILVLCVNSKAADVGSKECRLFYSNGRQPSSTPTDRLYSNCQPQMMGMKVDLFYEQLGKMMDIIFPYAAYNSSSSSGRLFATGEVDYDISKIYALAQCTRNQTGEACNQCLRATFDAFRGDCRGAGGTAILSTCYFRYDVYRFYHGPALVVVPSSIGAPPGPSVLPPANRSNGNQKKVRGSLPVIVICSGIGLVLICVAGICLWRKKRTTETDCNQPMILVSFR